MTVTISLADPTNVGESRFLFNTRSHPDIVKHLFSRFPASMSEHKRFLVQSHMNDRVIFIIRSDSTLVGYCQLQLTGPTAGDLSWVVHPTYQRKGIGSKAIPLLVDESFKRGFKLVHLHVVDGRTRIFFKAGFQLVSTNADGVHRMEYSNAERTSKRLPDFKAERSQTL